MEFYQIVGGTSLMGSVQISGAKNSVLPILAACVTCRGQCIIHNCPAISDVDTSVAILRHMGCGVQKSGSTLHVDAAGVIRCDIPMALMRDMRSSVLFMGAALARCGQAALVMPGGCALGERPIDLHLTAMECMGAQCALEGDHIACEAACLCGCRISLPFPSVGATENILLAAMGCKGTVLLENAAREPEIADLIHFLRAMGAEIYGEGTGCLEICGGKPLTGAEYTVMPDRIEAATYLAAVAACGGDAYLRGAEPETLTSVLRVLEEAGCRMRSDACGLRILAPGRLRAPHCVTTGPYPAFPTDAQAPIMAALLCARGESQMIETVFENRMRHVPELLKLGADIAVSGPCARVRGVEQLHGGELWGTDLRCGAALVIAALSARGASCVYGMKYIKRGYAALDAGLGTLGADIRLIQT